MSRSSRESSVRSSVTKQLRAVGFHVTAVDNESCSPGTPDVHYCGRRTLPAGPGPLLVGWIELKVLELPVRASSIVRADHYTPQQRLWHRQYAEAGGKIHVLAFLSGQRADVDDEWALLPVGWSADNLGKTPLDILKRNASSTWAGSSFLLDKILPWL